MKRLFLPLALIAVVAGGIIGWFCYDNANRDFTPWMSKADLASYLKKFEVAKDHAPDPWQKSHWITAAEGRWRDGTAEYRVRTLLAPPEWQGVWFLDLEQEQFGKAIKQYGDEGYVLVYYHSFKLPDGTMQYQGVWHKTK